MKPISLTFSVCKLGKEQHCLIVVESYPSVLWRHSLRTTGLDHFICYKEILSALPTSPLQAPVAGKRDKYHVELGCC